MPYRLLVVDDDPDYRLIVGLALKGQPSLAPAGEAASVEEAVGLATEIQPDLILLDLLLIGSDGGSTLGELAKASPVSTVLVTSAFAEGDGEVSLPSGRLLGHLSKGVPPSRLSEEILLLAGMLHTVGDALDVAAERLSPEPPSAARARRFVEETLARWECEELLDTVKLLVSELVGNAVAYARSDVEVAVKLLPDRLRIEVADESADWLRRRAASGDAVSGRGIDVVETLAESWGVSPRRGGKAVWFELPRPGAPQSEAEEPG